MEQQNSQLVFDLGDALDISHAAPSYQALRQLLEEPGEVLLDGAKVMRTDASGLQLLAAFALDCHAKHRAWRWSAMSEVLKVDITGLGLASVLQVQP